MCSIIINPKGVHNKIPHRPQLKQPTDMCQTVLPKTHVSETKTLNVQNSVSTSDTCSFRSGNAAAAAAPGDGAGQTKFSISGRRAQK